VASGEYSNIAYGGNDFEGAYVLGYEVVDGNRTLAITPFEGGNTCNVNVGPKDRTYRAWLFGPRNPLGLTFPFMVTTDKVAQLHFMNPSCEEVLPPLDSDSLPFWPGTQPTESVPGYLTLERNGDLSLLEPWDKKETTLAQGVRWIQPLGKKFWSLERPEDDPKGAFGIVVRDEGFEVLGRIDDVQEVVPTTDAKERAAYLQNDELYVATLPDLEPMGPIDADVCRPRFPGGFRGRGISYYSPCGSRTLNIYGSARLSDEGPGKTDRKYVLKSGSVGDPVIQFLEDRAVVFQATTDGADPETITLWGGFLGKELERIGDAPFTRDDSCHEHSIRLSSVNDEFQLFMDVACDVGRLIRWKPGSEVREVATGVRQCEGSICLANFDGETGDAVFVTGTGTVRKLASRVPEDGINPSDDGLALIADYDVKTGAGTLLVGTPQGKNLEEFATGVQIYGYQFLQNLKAVAYLRDFDPEGGTGVIGVRVLETGDTFDTGIRASEFREVGWPRPGMLYVVPKGDQQGIWFAALM
jgi:hypothetical protein